jgi:hypothetical protein
MQFFRPTGRRQTLRMFLMTAGALLVVADFCTMLPPGSLAQRLTFAVVGDSIASELGQGMQSLYRRSRRVHVIKKTRFSTGLVRTDY